LPKQAIDYWRIQGYDSTTKIYERNVALSQITRDQMKALLMALAAKAGLTNDEIVGCYATKRTKIYRSHLEIQRDGFTLMCGSNPHFVATIVDSNGRVKKTPKLD
jgi:hypothetical protein